MLSSPALRKEWQWNDCFQFLSFHTQVIAFFLYEKCLFGKWDEDWIMCAPKTMSLAQCKSSLFSGLLHAGTVRSPGLPTSVRQDSASSLPAPPPTTDRVGEGDPEMGPDNPREPKIQARLWFPSWPTSIFYWFKTVGRERTMATL